MPPHAIRGQDRQWKVEEKRGAKGSWIAGGAGLSEAVAARSLEVTRRVKYIGAAIKA
jgi:hypothetical protein